MHRLTTQYGLGERDLARMVGCDEHVVRGFVARTERNISSHSAPTLGGDAGRKLNTVVDFAIALESDYAFTPSEIGEVFKHRFSTAEHTSPAQWIAEGRNRVQIVRFGQELAAARQRQFDGR